MEKLKFTSDSFFNGRKQLLLEMVDERLHIVYGTLFTDIESERLLSPKETKQYVHRIDDLHIETWPVASENDDLTHISWEVDYDDVIHHGHYVYPASYDLFLDILDTLIPEAHLIDREQIQEAIIYCGKEILFMNRHFRQIQYTSPNRQFTIIDQELVDDLLKCIAHYDDQTNDDQEKIRIDVTRRNRTTTLYQLSRRRAISLREEIGSLFQAQFNKHTFQV